MCVFAFIIHTSRVHAQTSQLHHTTLAICLNHLHSILSSTPAAARTFVPISPAIGDPPTAYPPPFTMPSFAQHIEPGTFMVTPDLAYTHSPNTLTPPLSTEGNEAWAPHPNSINCGQAGFPSMMPMAFGATFKTEKSVIASWGRMMWLNNSPELSSTISFIYRMCLRSVVGRTFSTQHLVTDCSH